MLETVTQVRRAAADCAEAPVWSLSDQELVGCLEQAWAGVQQLTALVAHLIRQAEARGLPAAEAASSTVVWLRQRLRISPRVASRLVDLAKALATRPVLDAAVCAGTVSTEQAAAIAASVADLPTEAGTEVIDKAETTLIDWAGQFDAGPLSRLGSRILEHVAPEVAEQREGEILRRQEAKAWGKRRFTLSPFGDGSVRLSGWLDAAGAATVHAALDPLCHPRRDAGRGDQDAGSDTDHGTSSDPDHGTGSDADHGTSTSTSTGTGTGTGTEIDGATRTPAQRRADALVDVCALALRTNELPTHAGDPAQVVVTTTLATLTNGPAVPAGADATDSDNVAESGSTAGAAGNGVGWLDTGLAVSAAEARRMACDAHILPAVIGTDSQPLDLGRTRRLITGALRRALALRDGGCCFPGCDRPPRWCDGHHIVSWADGGATDLANTCLLCTYHHRLVHHTDWQVRLATDGRPEFLPPAAIDPQRRPRLNVYHRRQ